MYDPLMIAAPESSLYLKWLNSILIACDAVIYYNYNIYDASYMTTSKPSFAFIIPSCIPRLKITSRSSQATARFLSTDALALYRPQVN